MSAILYTADLTCSSKTLAAATRTGMGVVAAMSESALIAAASAGVRLVIVDLSIPRLDIRQTVAKLRGLAPPPHSILAFGPHVHDALLAEAQEAGCDRVLTRGQFHATLDDLLRELAAA